jgi:hypothetical protein
MVIVTEAMERVCQMPPGNYEETIAVAKKYGIALFPWGPPLLPLIVRGRRQKCCSD